MQIFRHFDLDIGVTALDGKSIIEAKLFGALAEPSGHLEVEEGNGIIVHVFLISLLFETYAVGDTTSSLDYFIDHVVTYRTILETYDVDHAVSLHCVFSC